MSPLVTVPVPSALGQQGPAPSPWAPVLAVAAFATANHRIRIAVGQQLASRRLAAAAAATADEEKEAGWAMMLIHGRD